MGKLLGLGILMSFMIPGIILGRFKIGVNYRNYKVIFVILFCFYLLLSVIVYGFIDHFDPRR
jgi:hypothetical protein